MADEVAQTLRIVSDSYPVDFISKFAEFRSMKRFTDITLRVGNEEFIAHKAVLSAASPTLSALFDDETKKEVDLPHEITPKVMIAVLDYMYSGRLQIKMEYFPLLFRNANYLGMENLKNEIPKALLARLNPGNCISTLFLATETGLRDVFLKAREVLAKQFRLISIREIQKLNRAQLECVLSMIQQSGGYFKFLVIIHWIKYDEVNHEHHLINLHDAALEFITYNFHKLYDTEELRELPKKDFEVIINAVQFTHPKNTYKAIRLWIKQDEFKRHSHMYELSSKFVDIGKLCCDTMEFELFMFTNDTEQMHVFNINRRSLLNINKPPEYNAFSAVRYRNTLFAVGGSFNGVYESFGLKYDFEEKEWSKFECSVRKKRPGVCIIDDRLYIAGGFSLPGLTGSNEFSCYNLQTGQLIDLPSSQESRASPGVVCYKSAVYVFGGIRDESFVGFYDPREGTWHNAGQIPSKHPGCTATLVENTIYWKDWYYSLYSYEPRQCSVRIEREFSEFGTITSCDNGLYIALQNSGIYEFIRENKMLKICRRKFKEPFILGYME